MAELPTDVLTFNERVSDPGATASAGKYYTKDVAGVTRWFYQDSAGVVSQLAAGLVPATNSVDYRHLTSLLVKGSANVLAATTSMQSVFDAANDTISLPANTTYKLRALYAFQNAPNTSLLRLGFSGGTIGVGPPGDALLNATAVTGYTNTVNTANAASRATLFFDSTANTWIVWDNVSVSFKWAQITGKLRTVSAGTFVPQIQMTNTLSTPTVLKMSYLELIPVGGSTFESVGQGGWA